MSSNTTERDLREIFERYGRVDSVKIIMDHGTGRSRGFGFVNFEDRTDATRVCILFVSFCDYSFDFIGS